MSKALDEREPTPTTERALDRPIWHALQSRQSHLGRRHGAAAAFAAEVSVLAAVAEPSREAFADLAKLVEPGEVRAIFGHAPADGPGPEWQIAERMNLVQMVANDPLPELDTPAPELTPLGNADVDEMLDLIELTRPGPFGTRTIEMGRYVGLRERGRLVAMAGERLALPGGVEVSAVCAHPDVRGRGLAATLVHAVVSQIQARGEIPFLHSARESPTFERATHLYRALGFRERREFPLTILLRDSPDGHH